MRGNHLDIDGVKAACSGRWRDVLSAVGGIDPAILDGQHHPCPKCGGRDRFRLIDESTGAVLCNQCFSEKNGDGIAAIQWATGEPFSIALRFIAMHVGVDPVRKDYKLHDDVDIVERIARRKQVPLASWLAFGASRADRGKLTVCRLPMYDDQGRHANDFDISDIDAKWSKGLGQKGKRAGVFLAESRPPSPGDTVLVVEGAKDAATLHSLGYQAVGIPTSAMAPKFARLFDSCNVTIIPDRDSAGEKGAQTSAARLYGVASSVRIAELPGELKQSKGEDVRDILSRDGGEALLRQAISDAREWEPSEDEEEGTGQRLGDDRVPVEVSPDEHLTNAAALRALVTREQNLFIQKARLVQVVRDEDDLEELGVSWESGTPRIRPVSQAALREHLSRHCYFYVVKETKDGISETQQHPPRWCVEALYSRPSWPGMRTIEAITQTPVIRPDGSVLDSPGWDAATGLLYEPVGGTPPIIPEHPTFEDARQAAERLLDLVCDFEFNSPADRSAWLAAVLTVISRPAIRGFTPLFVCHAPTAGSGKSLLTDCIAALAQGQRMPRMANPKDREETRKAILSLVLGGQTLVAMDNVQGAMGNDVLDMVLTGEKLTERLLGGNEMATVSLLNICWFATGNNIQFKGDTFRRVCMIRLQPTVERPDQRAGFKHAQLIDYVKANRMSLVVDAISIISAFVKAGRPQASIPNWGSFEEWTAIIRQALVWIGLPDPYATVADIVDESDSDRAAFANFVENWKDLAGDADGLTAASIAKLLNQVEDDDQPGRTAARDAALEFAAGKEGKVDGQKLGYAFRKHKGQVFGNVMFSKVESKSRTKQSCKWTVKSLQSQEQSGGWGDKGDDYGAHVNGHQDGPVSGIMCREEHPPSCPHPPSATDLEAATLEELDKWKF